jgi:hypothetical protein
MCCPINNSSFSEKALDPNLTAKTEHAFVPYPLIQSIFSKINLKAIFEFFSRKLFSGLC